jgi:hypothetical protein
MRFTLSNPSEFWIPDRPGQLPGRASTLSLVSGNHRPTAKGGPGREGSTGPVGGNLQPEFLFFWIVKITIFTTALLFF